MGKHSALLGALLVLGCAASTVNVSESGEDHSAAATAVIAGEKDSGARDLDVDISLPEPPPVMPGITNVDLRYVFTIANRGQSPVTVRRINIAGAGGAYRIETWSRTYKTTIAPGATEKLSFLARASDIDPNAGTRAPMTIRAEIEFENAGGVQRTAFVRNVGADVSFGVTRDQ